jgi:hypothetical protein
LKTIAGWAAGGNTVDLSTLTFSLHGKEVGDGPKEPDDDVSHLLKPIARHIPPRVDPMPLLGSESGPLESDNGPVDEEPETAIVPADETTPMQTMEIAPAEQALENDPMQTTPEVVDTGGDSSDIGPPDDSAEVVAPAEDEAPKRGGHNLRSSRFYGHKDGRWQDRKQVAMHIAFNRALKTYGEAAINSAYEEMKNMHDKSVFLPRDFKRLTTKEKKKIIRSSMFMKEKFLSTGAFEKLKARLVAGGNMQDRSDYAQSETSSPTVSLAGVYMTAGIAAMEMRKVRTIDFTAAYLNAQMDKEVLMSLEPKLVDILRKIDPRYGDFARDDGSLIVQLNKALYGCLESGKLWFNTVRAKLIDLGFVQNPEDRCVFNKEAGSGWKKQLTVALYVDDMMCTCAEEEQLDWLFEELVREFKSVKQTKGTKHSFLGQTWDFGKRGKVRVSMHGYIADLLFAYDVNETAVTPATAELFVIDMTSGRLSVERSEQFHGRVIHEAPVPGHARAPRHPVRGIVPHHARERATGARLEEARSSVEVPLRDPRPGHRHRGELHGPSARVCGCLIWHSL